TLMCILKSALLDAASVTLAKSTTKKKKWISEETFSLIKEKRKAKGHKEKYRQLQKKVNKLLRRDREAHLNNICEELEKANSNGNAKKIFQTVQKLTGEFKPRSQLIKDQNGKILTETAEILNRWLKYCEQLYADDSPPTNLHLEIGNEPPPTKAEVEKAIRMIKNGKATGPDGVPVELLKLGGDTVVDVLLKICIDIWKSRKWPKEWTQSTIIPIPKKGDLKECSNYRIISLVSHASKILTWIILSRIQGKVEQELAEEQAGFRPGRGTRDHICSLRIMIERARTWNCPLYLCFINFTKAFDLVLHDQLWTVMLEMGFPSHLVYLLSKLYEEQSSAVHLTRGTTGSAWFRPRRGVRQGCILSPYPFNIIAEMAMRKALEGSQAGFQIGGRKINNLRYTDDIILIATSRAELQDLVERLHQVGKQFSLKINTAKTKVLTTCGDNESLSITIGEQQLETVSHFKYLGSIVREDGKCEQDIKTRLGMARTTLRKMKTLWKNQNISTQTKIRLLVATYGCESWTLTKTLMKKIESCEMVSYRRAMKIPWTVKLTNEEVLQRAHETRNLLTSVTSRKLQYFGHMMRRERLEKDVILGRVPGKRGRGRPKRCWLDDIKDWTGITLQKAVHAAQDQNLWKNIVHVAAN
uniref:Reverse transcriptase domain-containing protein n=1 Tax=Latimeria chalumnae TaxID=7897 RepID=H3B2Y3_LATCH